MNKKNYINFLYRIKTLKKVRPKSSQDRLSRLPCSSRLSTLVRPLAADVGPSALALFVFHVSVLFSPSTPVLRPGAPLMSRSLLTPTFLFGESYLVRVETFVCLTTDLVPLDLTFSGGFPNPSSLSPVTVAVLHQPRFATTLTFFSTNSHPLLGSTPFIH